MSFFEAFFRGLVALVALFVIWFVVASLGNLVGTVALADISADTTRTLFTQQQETIRFLAEVNGRTTIAAIQGQTSQVWAREAGDTVRTVAALLAVGAMACVALWQGGKSYRRWLAERNRERAILLAYADAFFPDPARRRSVRVERVHGQLVARDYATRQWWSIDTARAALAERGLLTVDVEH